MKREFTGRRFAPFGAASCGPAYLRYGGPRVAYALPAYGAAGCKNSNAGRIAARQAGANPAVSLRDRQDPKKFSSD